MTKTASQNRLQIRAIRAKRNEISTKILRLRLRKILCMTARHAFCRQSFEQWTALVCGERSTRAPWSWRREALVTRIIVFFVRGSRPDRTVGGAELSALWLPSERGAKFLPNLGIWADRVEYERPMCHCQSAGDSWSFLNFSGHFVTFLAQGQVRSVNLFSKKFATTPWPQFTQDQYETYRIAWVHQYL